MEQLLFKEFFENSPTAFSYQKVISNEQGMPNDFMFINVNKAFENMMGLKTVDVINKRFYEVFPKDVWNGKEASKFHNAFQDAVIAQQKVDVDIHLYLIQKWLHVRIFPLKETYFACIFKDASNEHLLNQEIQDFFDIDSDMLCVADTNTNIIKVNNVFEKVMGYTVDEVEGKSFLFFIHEEDKEATIKATNELSDQKPVMSFTNRFRCKDGSYRYLEWHTKLNGGYVYSSARDITKKKINEIEQQKQFDLMNLLFTQSLTGIFFMMLEEPVVWNDSVNKEKVLDYVFEHQRITRVNQAMLNQYKAKEEDLIGAVPNILFRHDIEQGRRLWKKLFDDGQLPIESDEQRSDGSQMSVMGEYICLYDSMGRITGHFGTQIDVTERKIEAEKERQYQKVLQEKNQLIEMIMDNAPIGIWMSGEELGSIFTNKFFKDHFNLSSEEIAICHMTDQDAFIKGGLQHYEEIVTFSDNRKHTIETVKTKVNGEDDSNIGVLGIGLDITERKEAEKEVLYLSYHDQLTGLYNRRFYEEELKRIDTQRNFPITLVMADLNGLKLTNDAFGHNAGDELLKTFSRVLQQECREDDIIARIGGDEFVILLPKTDSFEAEKIVHRINKEISIQKVCKVPLSVSFGWQTKTDTNELFDQISKQAENLMYHKKLFKGNRLKGDTVKLITETLYENVETERIHSEKVSQYCEKIGVALGLKLEDMNELRLAGLLHDVGKIGIDKTILKKKGKLNESEWVSLKRHSEIGYQILRYVNEFGKIAEYVLAHHERLDGKGYPKGIKDDEIPLISKIISIADAYESMLRVDSYKDTLSTKTAIKELKSNSGTQFDERIAKVFVEKVLGEEWD